MEASPIKKIGGECAPPIHQHYTVQRDAYRAKAQGRRKYLFSDQIDDLIREIYLNHSGAKTRPGIRVLANKVGIPHWALKKRARELGLARTKELPWNEPELEILARYAWMSDERIRLKLKAAGYSRTVTGIHLKLRRMQFKDDPSFYSANGLAQALGIDSHAVSRWIRLGHLKAQLRGTARGEQQNGDIYLIREKDVRRFICNSAHNFAASRSISLPKASNSARVFNISRQPVWGSGSITLPKVQIWKHKLPVSTESADGGGEDVSVGCSMKRPRKCHK